MLASSDEEQVKFARALFEEEAEVDAAIRSGKTEFDWDHLADFEPDGEPRENVFGVPEGAEPYRGAWEEGVVPDHVREFAPEEKWEEDDTFLER